MDDTKAEPELSVFRLFLEARGIACPEGALEKRCPKEPDLLFRHADGSVVAYELVELLGQAFAHTLRRLCTTNRMLKDHFEGLPHEKRNLFLRLYGDADLFFWFGQKTTQDQRRNVLPVAFCKLLALPDGANHEVLKNDPALLPTLISVTISRGLARPVFDSDSYVRTGYPEAPLIQKKFENCYKNGYKTSHPLELLAYREIYSTFPDEVWRKQLQKFLDAQQRPFPFRHIWILDCATRKVIFECSGS